MIAIVPAVDHQNPGAALAALPAPSIAPSGPSQGPLNNSNEIGFRSEVVEMTPMALRKLDQKKESLSRMKQVLASKLESKAAAAAAAAASANNRFIFVHPPHRYIALHVFDPPSTVFGLGGLKAAVRTDHYF